MTTVTTSNKASEQQLPEAISGNLLSGNMTKHDEQVTALVSHVNESELKLGEALMEGFDAFVNLSANAEKVSTDVRDSIAATNEAMQAENRAMEGRIDKMLKARLEGDEATEQAAMAECVTEFQFALGVDVQLKAEKLATQNNMSMVKFMKELKGRLAQKTFSKTDCFNYDRKRQHFNRYLKKLAEEMAKGSESVEASQLLLTVQTEGGKTVIKQPKAKTKMTPAEVNEKAMKDIEKAFEALDCSKQVELFKKLGMKGRDVAEKLLQAATECLAAHDEADAEEIATKAAAAQEAAQPEPVADITDEKIDEETAQLIGDVRELDLKMKRINDGKERGGKRAYTKAEKEFKAKSALLAERGYNVDEILKSH